MSKYLDVTLIPTAGPGREYFKLGQMPVRICRQYDFWTTNSYWYIVQPGPFMQHHETMLLMWYDGMSVSNTLKEFLSSNRRFCV